MPHVPKGEVMTAHLLVGSSPLGMIPRVMDEIAGTRVLDVGCGCGVYGYLLRNKWQDTPSGHVQFRDFAISLPSSPGSTPSSGR